MSRETDLWGLSGLAWLEVNISRPWPEQLERQARETWLQSEDWIVQCHPWRGFLLLLREYINGEGRESEARLRKLIPVLARNGDPQQIIAAFSLLGVLILEIRGWEPEIEALHQHVQNESAEPGTLAYVLRQFLLAQKAVFSDRKADADEAYGALLGRQAGTDEAAQFAMGRIFEKMALYLWRYPSHSHESRWKMAVGHWCARIPDSIVTRRLQSLEKHPIQSWRLFRSSLRSEGTGAVDIVNKGRASMTTVTRKFLWLFLKVSSIGSVISVIGLLNGDSFEYMLLYSLKMIGISILGFMSIFMGIVYSRFNRLFSSYHSGNPASKLLSMKQIEEYTKQSVQFPILLFRGFLAFGIKAALVWLLALMLYNGSRKILRPVLSWLQEANPVGLGIRMPIRQRMIGVSLSITVMMGMQYVYLQVSGLQTNDCTSWQAFLHSF